LAPSFVEKSEILSWKAGFANKTRRFANKSFFFANKNKILGREGFLKRANPPREQLINQLLKVISENIHLFSGKSTFISDGGENIDLHQLLLPA
jgi:hypothetical protein